MTFPAARTATSSCSARDGLTTMVSDDEIAHVLLGARDLDGRGGAARWSTTPTERGGRDNITAIAFRLGRRRRQEAAARARR